MRMGPTTAHMVPWRRENVVMDKGSYLLFGILFWVGCMAYWAHGMLGMFGMLVGVDGDYVHSWFLGGVVGSRQHCCPLQRHHLTKHVLIQ